MQLFTPVHLPSPAFRLSPQSRILMLGSCFAEHIGQHLLSTLPERQVLVNPFGVLYGEHVLHDSLRLLLDEELGLPEDNYFEDAAGQWHSWAHSGAFNADSREACQAHCQAQRAAGSQLLAQAQVLVLTLSTDRHYRLLTAPHSIVANCHKQPSRLFTEEADTLAEQMARWQRLIEDLQKAYPQVHILFTLSPYRYAKYGLHENQLSKAKLLLLIDHLCQHNAACHYFPAYEIVLDQLRDYRFYKPDMLHPSEQAIDYVWQQFADWAFSPELHEFGTQYKAILRDLQHRPLHPDSAAHADFLARLEQRMAQFEQRWGVSPRSSHD